MSGWSNLYKRNNPKNNTDFYYNLSLKLSNQLIIGRVTDILLDDINQDKFKRLGEWNGIGNIVYESVVEDEADRKIGIARPLDANFKRFPLINELVIILPFNDSTGLNNDNPYTSRGYYFPPIGVWNHPHHNAFPKNPSNVASEQKKSYVETTLGSFSNIASSPLQINLGNNFEEKGNVKGLSPYEGDVIIEGRWGNSIRFGSTVKDNAYSRPNFWSRSGNNGDPIIIIRNGQYNIDESNGYEMLIENTSNSLSSIYLTSTQNVSVNTINDYESYPEDKKPQLPNEYSGNQIILDSGRLLFNSKEDHILLSSIKSINLNSKESVNIDTKKFITQADNIYLGREDMATEPLLLGNKTVDVIKKLTEAVKQLTNLVATLESDKVIADKPATFSSLYQNTSPIRMVLDSLEAEFGISPETCTLTSKRNFTSK